MSLNPHKTLWLSWYPHRRTSGICQAWEVPLEIIESSRRSPISWLSKSCKTIKTLHRKRPDVLFVQNPSLGLTILAVLLRSYFRYLLVVDAHNEGVRPFVRSGLFVQFLTRWLLRAADTNVVTNDSLANEVSAMGGRVLILPDPLPTPNFTQQIDVSPRKKKVDVAVICTYAADEPILDILAAAKLMPEKIFACTGRVEKFESLGLQAPENVEFTGFLTDQKYWDLLASASVICDLTLMPDCLVCGAYEALSVGRPMVLSSNKATEELFGSVAILTESEPSSIANALQNAFKNEAEISRAAIKEAHVYQNTWQSNAQKCLQEIEAQKQRHER